MVERDRESMPPAPVSAPQPEAPLPAAGPAPLGVTSILALQQTAGNAAVTDMLARWPLPGPLPAAPPGEPVLQSSHPEVTGKPISAVGADLHKRDQRHLDVTPLIRNHAVQTQLQEIRWDDKLGLMGNFIDVFNDEEQPNPQRWFKVIFEWDMVKVELIAALATPATPETINHLGRKSEQALDHWKRTAELSSRYTNEFEAYLKGFSHSAETVLVVAETVRDVSFAVAVGAAVIAFAPATFAVMSGYAGAVGLTGTAATVAAGGGTVLAMGGMGAAMEGGGQVVGTTLAQGFWMLEDLIIEGRSWNEAVDNFDWAMIKRNGWTGLKNGFVDGILALAGVKLEQALARPAGALINRVLGPGSGSPLAIVLRRALQRAMSSGASGSVIGALDAGLKVALAGGSREQIEAAMKKGFAIGGVGGTVIGAGVGAAQGRAEAKALAEIDDAFNRLERGEIPQSEHMEQYRAQLLEPGEQPGPHILERGRYEDIGDSMVKEGLSQATILRDRKTGELWFFKPREGQVTIGWTQDAGIETTSYPRRAVAGEIASKQAGLETPEIYLAQWDGQVGSMQRWINGTRTLASLDYATQQAIMASPEYVRLRAAIDNFDYLIQNIDRNAGNVFVELGPDGRLQRLIPIDHDRIFPPVPESQILPDRRVPFPTRYSRAAYRHFQAMDADRTHLQIALRGLLTEPEVQQALRRLTEIMDDIRQKLATLGEGGTFVD